MNVSNSPLSPFSLDGIERIGNLKSSIIKSDSINENNLGQLASPLISSGPSNLNGRFHYRGATSVNGNPGYPSPPSSIARSSGGVGYYLPSESGMSRKDDQVERSLIKHYSSLKKYLSISQVDGKDNPRPNRARDKLLRLSPVQFHELSTDVYDELIRRQQDGKGPGPNGGSAPYLLPREIFHPKRNQARQKLSTLPLSRFKDLATDVFYELERRLPTVGSDDFVKVRSPTTSIGGLPTRIDIPMNENPIRPPSETSSVTYSLKSESRNGPVPPINDSISSPESVVIDFVRPTPKSFQNSTIIPNKSTIVEDDETEEEDSERDALGLEDAARIENDSIRENEKKIKASQGLSTSVEEKLRKENGELDTIIKSQEEQISQLDDEKRALQELTTQLETKLTDSLSLNESLKVEINQVKEAEANTVKDLQATVNELKSSQVDRIGQDTISEILNENKMLKEDLNEQKRNIEEARYKIQEALREMQILYEQSRLSSQKEEHLLSTIQKLEDEIKNWRDRYVKIKTQVRSLTVYPIDLNVQKNSANIATNNDFTDANGMAKDINVINFQVAVNDLLQYSRHQEPEKVMEGMRSVVLNTRNILQDISTATTSGKELTPLQKKVKLSVTVAAKNLITASKNFVAASGLSPVSLLDAAISHLTSAVIQLLRIFKIRPTPEANFQHMENFEALSSTELQNEHSPANDQNPEYLANLSSNFGPTSFRGSCDSQLSSNSSIYSSFESPRGSELRGEPSPNNESRINHNTLMSRREPSGAAITPLSLLKGIPLKNKARKSEIDQLKLYLQDQTVLLVRKFKSLVPNAHSESARMETLSSINVISKMIGDVIYTTENAMSLAENTELRIRGGSVIKNLITARERLIEAGVIGCQIIDEAKDDGENERAWKAWNQSLPPIAFGMARDMKELLLRVDAIEIANRSNYSSPVGEKTHST